MFMLRGARAAITFCETSDRTSDNSPRPPPNTLPKDTKFGENFKKLMKVGSQPVTKKGPAAKMALVMNYLDILGNMVTYYDILHTTYLHTPYTFLHTP